MATGGQSDLGSVGSDKKPPEPPPVNLRTFFNGQDGAFCSGSNGNCGPDVIVTLGNKIFKSIFEVIATKDPIAIQNAFSRQKANLKSYLAKDVLDLAISGAYKVSAINNEATQTSFMIFTSARTGAVEMVYPIVTR